MIKLLAYAEASIPTGWERVAREILTYLHNTGEFDVTVMATGGHPANPAMRYPYPVYSAGATGNDPVGVTDFHKIVRRRKPDVIWLLHDLWYIKDWLMQKPIDVPAVIYFPIDTPNVKWHFCTGLGAATRAATYTQFAARETAAAVRDFIDLFVETGVEQDPKTLTDERGWYVLQDPRGGKVHGRFDILERYQNPEGFAVIPHGLDASKFAIRNKGEARRRLGVPESAFVVLNVNRNQQRKRLDTTIRAFAKLAQESPEAVLVMHCAEHTLQGWDLEQLARFYGVSRRCLFLHEAKDVLSEDELVDVYNAADVQINTAGGEGWGLTSVEGAACGVPQLVPNWSATKEIWADGAGVLLPVRDFRFETKFLNTAHADVDADAAGEILIHLWKNPDERERLRQAGQALVARQWTWPQVGEAFAKLLREAMTVGKPVTRTLESMVAGRIGEVRSELHSLPG